MPSAYYVKLGSGADQISGASRDRHHIGWIKLVSFWMGDSRANAATADAEQRGARWLPKSRPRARAVFLLGGGVAPVRPSGVQPL